MRWTRIGSGRWMPLVALGIAGWTVAARAPATAFYVQHNLVSDGFVPADFVDANLVNAMRAGAALFPFRCRRSGRYPISTTADAAARDTRPGATRSPAGRLVGAADR